jgi:multidrug transporter EmrE-like cation transporter
MQIVLLLAAALSYSIGGYYMKLAEGFSKGWPSLVVLGLFCLGASLQMFAMRQSEMTVSYMMVLGFEAITAVAIGSLFLNEGFTLSRLLGVLIVAVGVAVLRA